MSRKAVDRSRAARVEAALAESRAGERRRNLVVGTAVAAVLALVVVVGFALTRGSDPTGRADSGDALPRGVEGTSVVVGDPDAPATITVYEDLQCPVCRQFEEATGDAIRAAVAAGEVRVDYRLVAFLDRASTTDYSSRALNALLVVLDAEGPEAFEAYHRLLFEQQPSEGGAGLDDDALVALAVEAGADEADVRGPIEDRRFEQWVVDATDQMSRDGVTGTPTVLIDGEPAGADPASSARAVLDLVGD